MRKFKQQPALQSLRRYLHSSSPAHAHGVAKYKSPEAWTNSYVVYNNDLVAENENGMPLKNLPIALKDNICTKAFKTTCSSAILRDFVSPYDATVVRLLRSSGARIVGKTNCDEFGMGSNNIHSMHGPALNPHRSPSRVDGMISEQRSAGGSSGGSAAAVASGTCYAALGTDTGGSVRLPATYCGVAGLKPSYGLISRWGVISYADSLDCVGILANSTEDIKPVFSVSRYDPKDPTSASEGLRKRASDLENASTMHRGGNILDGLRIGIPQEYFPEELDKPVIESVRRIVKLLEDTGAKVVPVTLPSTRYALSAYYVIASAEASSNLARYSGVHYGSREDLPSDANKKVVSSVYSHTRSKGFGHEVQKRILLGSYALTADAFDNYFLQAQRVRQLVKSDFNHVFKVPSPLYKSGRQSRHRGAVDILLHPSAIGTAPTLTELDKSSPLDAYVQDVLTVPASLAGLPALSVPAGLSIDKWPLGVSVVGQWGFDRLVLEVGSAIEHLMK